MLRIRPEQMQVFQPVADAAFVNRLSDLIRNRHPDVEVQLPDQSTTVAKLPHDSFREMVRLGVARGRQHGLTWQSSLGGFVLLMFVAAPNFDSHPMVRRVLKDERVPGDLRIDQLWKRTSGRTWERVRDRYDPAAWQSDAADKNVASSKMVPR